MTGPGPEKRESFLSTPDLLPSPRSTALFSLEAEDPGPSLLPPPKVGDGWGDIRGPSLEDKGLSFILIPTPVPPT